MSYDLSFLFLLMSNFILGREQLLSETQLLYDCPTLSAMDLGNVWMYFAVNSEEIETAIKENRPVG